MSSQCCLSSGISGERYRIDIDLFGVFEGAGEKESPFRVVGRGENRGVGRRSHQKRQEEEKSFVPTDEVTSGTGIQDKE